MEFGSKLSEDMSLIIGAGYQATFGAKTQKGDKALGLEDSVIQGYSAFIQLPYKISSNFTFAPQVSYYQTAEANSKSVLAKISKKQALSLLLESSGISNPLIMLQKVSFDTFCFLQYFF